MSLFGSRILITGGSGTFGTAFTQFALSQGAARVIGLADSEYRMAAYIKRFSSDARVCGWLGNVRDRDRLDWAFRAGLDLVIHAAALKRIELCEADPAEAVKTNIDGTRNVVEAAMLADVPRVIVISSDKATSPETCYGKTKAAAEEIAIGQNSLRGHGRTKISVVRYGNVMGSAGSVLETWWSARESGAPITVTDPDATRFWWTIEDAAAFVARIAEWMQGGEIWLPKLPSATTLALAQAWAPRSAIRVTGMRGTEKQHEAMIAPAEVPYAYELPDAYVLLPKLGHWWSAGIPEGAVKVPPEFRYTSDQHIHAVEVRESPGEGQPCVSPS